jgi:hypothetical protein
VYKILGGITQNRENCIPNFTVLQIEKKTAIIHFQWWNINVPQEHNLGDLVATTERAHQNCHSIRKFPRLFTPVDFADERLRG